MKVVVTLTKDFFKGHSRQGQPTRFAEAVQSLRKIHTCRGNYYFWAKKIEALKSVGGTLCIREWTGKPYRSKQGTIKEIASDVAGISLLVIRRNYTDDEHGEISYTAEVDGQPIALDVLAKNDGFRNVKDFIDFFAPMFKKNDTLHLGIIHFSPFRYGNTQANAS